MTSSMLSGERRWASRRGGMTVLGKVAVPKPINLPSQKLENHGLDPNVEIVPKGTLSWGSRSSSSPTNAWGSSTLSPKADGGSGSPSHLSGRPSSSSGTRPSTASSDRAPEPIANSWNSNSRPSSASGALTSNQTSATSLRPRSAETRPGSSQLSRFAEPLSENAVAWGTGTAEKLLFTVIHAQGVRSSKNDGFSLISGDFPTLGSEKDNAGKNMDSQDYGSHGQPGSPCDGVAAVKDRTGTSVAGDVSVNANVRSGAANSWRRDNNPYGEDGARPSVEKWQGDSHGPQPYPNAGGPHHHYEAWHGPPINNHQGCVWYGGPPGGPPFGSPVPPRGFPMEPFHFYRPQIPATALANPQPVPPPGPGPRAHHPKNGDMYRPPMPDAYMHPGMPIRPGFYPGPRAYEGYYRPPVGFHNSNEQDVPFMGMAAGPPAYNRYSGQNVHDPGNSHGRSSARGHSGKPLPSEQVEPGHAVDSRGPYRVLLKQQDGWEGKDEEHKWEDSLTTYTSHVEKEPKVSSLKNDWRGDYRKDEQMGLNRKTFSEEAYLQASDHEGRTSSVPVKLKSPESMGNVKVADDSLKKVEHAATGFTEIPAAPKDSSLIQKIEGLNAKARGSDGRHDLMNSSREEQKSISQVVTADFDEAANGSLHIERNYVLGINNPAAYEGSVAAGDKRFESTAVSGIVISRRSTNGVHGRIDHRGKGRFSSQEADGWREKSPVAESSSVVSAPRSESSNIHKQDHPAKEATEKSETRPQGKHKGESGPPMFEPSDSQAQRAKIRELAKERVKQRQKEEEELARDQKTKALAKLEELNNRAQATEGLTQKSKVLPSVAIQNKQEEFQSIAESTMLASKSGTSSLALASSSNDASHISETGPTGVEKSSVLSNEQLLERHESACKESIGVHKHNEPMPMKQDVDDAGVHHHNATPVYDVGASKQKRLSSKQKHNIPTEKNSSEKFITNSTTEAIESHSDLITDAAASHEIVAADEIAPSSESSLPVNPNIVFESSMQHRKRNNRSSKKHRLDEASSGVMLPAVVSTETNILINTSSESGKTKVSETELDPSSVQPPTDSKAANQSSELRLSSPGEENHVRANNQWKSQHSRRMQRSAQSNKSVEKFHTNEAVIWAPVRAQNKVEVTGEASQKPVVEASSVKSDNQLQNNSRNKRAELERYIPKPVAKEMAQQQGSGPQQLMALSVDKTTSDENDGKADSGSQGVESSQPAGIACEKKTVTMESKNGDNKHNKQGKVHGSWRQRGTSESTTVQGLQDAQHAHSSNASRSIQKLAEHQQIQKPDASSVKEQPKYSDEWSSSDGWNMPENSETVVPLSVPAVKDHGGTARGKRHQFKGHKGSGNNHDHDRKKINSGDTDKRCTQSSEPVTKSNQTDIASALKENHATGDRSTSHWQPKPQAHLPSNEWGSRPNSGQNVGVEVVRPNKKESTPQGGLLIPPQPHKETSESMAQLHRGHSTLQTSKAEEASNGGHLETKRERKIASVKGRPDSPNQGPVSLVESAPPSNMDNQHEQRVPSGFRRNGNQNSLYSRGHESRGDWSSSGQDNKQPMNRERQRHNSHYEYQPVGHYNNNRANNFQGPKGAPNNAGGNYRERGQSHARRGGGSYHGRSSGAVQADGSYD